MKRGGIKIRHWGLQGIGFIMPWLLGFLFLQIFPMVSSLIISFTKWDILTPPRFIGGGNWIKLLTSDPLFLKALGNTLLYMVVGNGLGLIIALMLAALLYENIPGKQLFKVIILLPNLVLPVAFGLMMQPVWGGGSSGLVNMILSLFGVQPIYWLEEPALGIWVMILLNFWFTGASTLIFYAGILSIPHGIYEAAEIDGARWFGKFIHITLPVLRPLIFFQGVMGMIHGLQIFDIPAALADMGGSTSSLMGKQNSLATMVYYLYIKAFRNWKMGEASALGWIIFLIGLLFTLVLFSLNREKDFKGEI